MQETTVGKILLKNNVPDHLKSHVNDVTLDKKGIASLFQKLSDGPSDTYKEFVTKLARLGFEVATRQGSTVPLTDLNPLDDKEARFDQLDKDLAEIKRGTGTKREKDQKIGDLYGKFTKDFEDALMAAGIKKNHTLAKVITSGSRGSMAQYRQTVGGVILVNDEKGRPITDFPIRHSFAEGLSIPEYLLHSYGTRAGAIGTKLSVADSGFFCFTAETLVRMADFSVRRIADIKIGDWVLGANKVGNTFPVQVKNVFANGIKEVFEFKFRKLKSRKEFIIIEGTEGHEVLAKFKRGKTYNSGVKKIQLSEANKSGFGLIPAKECMSNKGHEEKYAHLLGVLLGDGGLSGPSINFSCVDTELLTKLNLELEQLNLVFNKTPRQKEDNIEYTLQEIERTPFNRTAQGQVVAGIYMPVRKWLDEMGVLGKKSFEKTIPAQVTGWNNASVAKLIAGLIETDGCISFTNNGSLPTINFTCTSEEMVYQLRELLEVRFGIYAPSIGHRKLTGKKVKPSKKAPFEKTHKHDAYSVTINDPESVKRFHQLIPIVGVKKQTFDELMGAYIPADRDDSTSFAFLSKARLPDQEVYDFEVDFPDHLYVLANGAVVSNSKQLSRAAMPIKIEEHDCGTDNGIPVPISDKDSCGTFLAKPVGGYNKNNEVTPGMLAALKIKGIDEIVVKSPMTCQAGRRNHAWSVCQLCAGKRESGRLSPIGSYLGVTAATALGEPLAQGTLNTKHTSSGSTLGKTTATGFKLIQQLANIPHTFQNRAAIAETEGTVTTVRKLPQGGHEIVLNTGAAKPSVHYVPTGFDVTANVGDKVETGDVMSEGLVNPADIVKYKGIGEGRRYYADIMRKAFEESGMGGNRRNFEVIAKAAIDHVKITHPDGLGNHLADAVVSYQSLEKDYKPRPDSQLVRSDLAIGKYLEEPVLHYTIGTKVTSTVANYLKRHDVQSVRVHNNPPPFEPEMHRLLDIPGHVPDWAHQLYSTYLEKRLIKGVNEGLTSNLKGPSPILGLAYGIGFGHGKLGEVYDDSEEDEENS
jgi:hypothetical protein